MLPCATPRAKSRDCMASAINVDVDLKQQLIYMQMTIKEIGSNVNGLERKIDATSHGINSVEQALFQMKQQQIASRVDNGSNLVELDSLLKKNIQQALGMRGEISTKADNSGASLSAMHHESLKKVEQGVNDLLAKGNSSGSLLPGLTEGKAGAPVVSSNLRNEVREELELLQISLTKEIKMLQESLLQDFQQRKASHSPRSQRVSEGSIEAASKASIQVAEGSMNAENVSQQLESLQVVLMRELQSLKAEQFKATPQLQSFEESAQENPMRAGLSADSETVVIVSDVPESDALVPQTDEKKKDIGGVDSTDVVEHTRKAIGLRDNSSLAAVFGNDDDMEVPPYHVEDFYHETGICQQIARSNNFANFTVAVVIFNAVYIGFDSDYNTSQNIYQAGWPFQACSQFFCVYFTWELVVRFLAFDSKRNCMKDGWFKFDAFLVSTMILDTWVLMPTLFMLGGGVKVPTQPLRMLRLFKLTRMARLMKSFPELVTMIKGLIRSLRAISSSMILVGLMVYVWAIMMHMLMKEEETFNEELWVDARLSFGTMTRCIWTLLMAGTMMLDDASPLMSLLLFSDKFNYVLGGFLFVCYSLLSAMCILQMLIGVLCDVVSTVKAEEQSATAIGLLKQELLSSLTACDDGDGKISQEELHTVMYSTHSKALFKKLNVNHTFLIELMKEMYTKPGMQVPIKDILELMVMCRGDNVATVETMAGALVRILKEVADVKVVLEKDLKQLQAPQQRRTNGHSGQ